MITETLNMLHTLPASSTFSEMDSKEQEYILTQAKLKLSDDIEESEIDEALFIIKHIPSKNYLIVEDEQHRLLQSFKHTQTLKELVPELINNRKCPPLRDLYELVLKAVVSGILTVEGKSGSPDERVHAAEWEHSLSFGLARYFGVTAILCGIFGTLFSGVTLPQNAFEIVLGYVIVCGSISLGFFLSACLLRGFDREVYDTQIKWKHPFPHFYCNVEDGKMAGRTCEVSIALMQLAPLFTMLAVAAVGYPSVVFVLLLGCLFHTAPLGRSPSSLLIRALYRRYPLSTNRDFVFVQNRLMWTLLNKRIKFLDKKFLLAFSFYTLLWLVIVFFGSVQVFNVNAIHLLTEFFNNGGKQTVSVGLMVVLGILILGSLAILAWIAFNNIVNIYEELRTKKGQKRRAALSKNAELTTDGVIEFLKDCLLLKDLDVESLSAIAHKVSGSSVPAKTYIFRQDDPGDELYFVYEGEVDVLMELKSGRPMRVTSLKSGDVFGEIALIQNVPRTRSIRAKTKSLVLSLSRTDFQELILKNLGTREVQTILEKESFLHRIELCKDWHPQAMVRFAQMASFSHYKANDTVISKGRANQFFYLIYDGMLEVVDDGKTLAKLSAGQFFGEISLLQNSVSTANVVAKLESRCMVISRKDFLNFIGSDFFIGLQFEDISSKRLKHPIFPLTGVNYDDMISR